MGLVRQSIIFQIPAYLEMKAAVQEELSCSWSNVEYVREWSLLLSKGAITCRELVRKLLMRLVLEGVERRRSRKFRWRICGTFDKLKLIGFSIHCCIDRYSKRGIWSQVSTSDICPSLIVSYYLLCVSSLQWGCLNREIWKCQGRI